MIAVNPHSAVAMVAVEWTAGGIDRDQVVVNAEPVALGIAIRKKAPLQHLVGRKADAWYDVGRVEGRLLDLGKIVFRVAVQFEDAYLNQRIILVEPYLGQVKGIVWTFSCILLLHYLDEHGPAREFNFFDTLIQVSLVAFPVPADYCLSLCITQVFDPLLSFEVKLDPVPFVFCVDETEGVTAEAVHMAVGSGYAPVTHDDSNLVQRLGQRCPEVAGAAGTAHVGTGVTLDSVVQVTGSGSAARARATGTQPWARRSTTGSIEFGRKT